MTTISPTRSASRADLPSNFSDRSNADFARQMTLSAFGWKNGKALDQANFNDRPPGELPRPSPGVSLL